MIPSAKKRFFRNTSPALLRLIACALALFGGLSPRVEAFVFLTSPATIWRDSTIQMDLQLGERLTTPLKDGSTSFNSVTTNALALWNQSLTIVKFTSRPNSRDSRDGDGVNQVFFDSTIYGQSFPEDVLAVTTRWSIGATRLEGDIIVNSAVQWDSYRGRLQEEAEEPLYDFRRMVLHELGHVLGLDHPDEAGQRVLAIMNSSISDLDNLAADDRAGASALYGGAPLIVTEPQSQTVTAGGEAEFRVVATGIAPLSYQWFFNGFAIVAATNDTYSIRRVQSRDVGAYTAVVSNALGSVESAPATLAIDQDTAFGIVGVLFGYQIVANNNPTWFSASGLPRGLRCNGATGLISGVPTETGTFSVDVTAKNLFSSVSATIVFTIDDGEIFPIGALGIVEVPFFYQIIADNDPTWYSASGLPPGLSYDGRTGLITGIPTRTGQYSVDLTARNLFASISATVSFFIDDGEITSADTAQGIVGVPFTYRIIANNNPTWYSAKGLPRGLRYNGATGLISGLPNESGTFSVDVTARNLFASISETILFTIRDGTIGTGSQPFLSTLRTGDRLLLTWPAISNDFVLEETQLHRNAWTNSSAKILAIENENVALIPTAGTAKFYRLRK
jgi:hypothetical protein